MEEKCRTVRRETPLFYADGTFTSTITMNPWAIVHEGNVYLFYAGDDESGRRQIRLATAQENDPENFTFRGTVIKNSEIPGDFDYAWCVLPHVIKLPDGTFYMLYSGNRGSGAGLSTFPGLGVARSTDLIHWEKYKHNPVLTAGNEPDYPLIGIAGGGLYCEDRGAGQFTLHLFYTGCPTLGDNILRISRRRFAMRPRPTASPGRITASCAPAVHNRNMKTSPVRAVRWRASAYGFRF